MTGKKQVLIYQNLAPQSAAVWTRYNVNITQLFNKMNGDWQVYVTYTLCLSNEHFHALVTCSFPGIQRVLKSCLARFDRIVYIPMDGADSDPILGFDDKTMFVPLPLTGNFEEEVLWALKTDNPLEIAEKQAERFIDVVHA